MVTDENEACLNVDVVYFIEYFLRREFACSVRQKVGECEGWSIGEKFDQNTACSIVVKNKRLT
jgi:hypothetical protein